MFPQVSALVTMILTLLGNKRNFGTEKREKSVAHRGVLVDVYNQLDACNSSWRFKMFPVHLTSGSSSRGNSYSLRSTHLFLEWFSDIPTNVLG